MRFKDFITEGRRPLNPEWFCKTKAEAEKLLHGNSEGYSNTNYLIDDKYIAVKPVKGCDRKLLITENNMIHYSGNEFRFGFDIWEVKKYLEVRVHGKIGSLIGLSNTLDSSIYLSAEEINFDWLPHMQNQMLALGYDTSCGLSHLKGIGKAKNVVGYITLGETIKSNILGLAQFTYSDRTNQIETSADGNEDLTKACKIMTKEIEATYPRPCDFLDVQEALITAGYKDYAKL